MLEQWPLRTFCVPDTTLSALHTQHKNGADKNENGKEIRGLLPWAPVLMAHGCDEMPAADCSGGRGWASWSGAAPSISPSSEAPTTPPTRPDSQTPPLGEVDRQQDSHLLPRRLERGGGSPSPGLLCPSSHRKEGTRGGGCHCATSRWMTGNTGDTPWLGRPSHPSLSP